ncbi:hypothetical protein [Nonomuraea polychroma]|nr:hypothetical protein [Nonomuraea polychroma]
MPKCPPKKAQRRHPRMIFSGVFDRFPDLQVIAGHWGEVVMF